MSEFTHRLPHQGWSKPSRNEEEYFHREEFRIRMEAARKREARRQAVERQKLLELHEDHCPKCGGELEVIKVPEGQADQCPNCLGVWLDHETFDRLTHPDEKEREENEFLTRIFREQLLQFTTGKVRDLTSHEDDEEE